MSLLCHPRIVSRIPAVEMRSLASLGCTTLSFYLLLILYSLVSFDVTPSFLYYEPVLMELPT